MIRHKAIYLGLALVLVLAVVAGCATPAPASPTAAPAPTAAPQATQPPAGQPTTAPAPTPATGAQAGKLADKQILRLNLGQEPPTLDPTLAEDSSAISVLDAVQEGLVQFKHDLTVEPGLAEKWEVSPDGKTITFTLRDGIKYSDGVPVKAADFVYSWKRLLNPETAAPYNSLLGDIKGATEYMTTEVPTDTAKLPELEKALGFSAPDDKTFKVELKGPSTYFVTICALWNTVPLRQDVIEKHKESWTEPANYVSTGPFKIQSWEHQAKIVLVPNEHYYGKKPILQEVRIGMIGEQKAELEAFKNGELDVCNDPPMADVPAMKADPELSKMLVKGAQLSTYYIGFNTRKPPFDNAQVRQAFASAIDRQAIVDVVMQGVPYGPATSFVPPGMPAHSPELGYKFDVAKAKALLAEAGYPDGQGFPEVTIAFNSPPVPGHRPVIEFIQDQLKKNLNVSVKIEAMEWGAYLDACEHDTPQMYRMGWSADYPHPQNFLDVVFRSTSANNYTGYKNEQYDQLLDQAAVTADQAEQEKLYQQAEKIFIEDAPIIPIYFYGHIELVRPWVQGLVVTPMDSNLIGSMFLDEVSIAAH